MVAALAEDGSDLAIGDAGWALAGFDRDGAAAEGRARARLVPGAEAPQARVRRERRGTADGGLTAWQALFDHGRLRDGERVLIHGATGPSADGIFCLLFQAVRERPSGQTVLDAFGRFVLEPRGFFAAKDEATATELIAVARMIAASPALLTREQQIFARYTDTLAGLIADETGAASGDLRPYIAANALMGVHRALIAYVRARLNASTPNRRRLARDVRSRGETALALLADGLGDYPVRDS